jgi:hypothetical protein
MYASTPKTRREGPKSSLVGMPMPSIIPARYFFADEIFAEGAAGAANAESETKANATRTAERNFDMDELPPNERIRFLSSMR